MRVWVKLHSLYQIVCGLLSQSIHSLACHRFSKRRCPTIELIWSGSWVKTLSKYVYRNRVTRISYLRRFEVLKMVTCMVLRSISTSKMTLLPQHRSLCHLIGSTRPTWTAWMPVETLSTSTACTQRCRTSERRSSRGSRPTSSIDSIATCGLPEKEITTLPQCWTISRSAKRRTMYPATARKKWRRSELSAAPESSSSAIFRVPPLSRNSMLDLRVTSLGTAASATWPTLTQSSRSSGAETRCKGTSSRPLQSCKMAWKTRRRPLTTISATGCEESSNDARYQSCTTSRRTGPHMTHLKSRASAWWTSSTLKTYYRRKIRSSIIKAWRYLTKRCSRTTRCKKKASLANTLA